MANTPAGSFIPKRSTGKVSPARSGRRIYVFSYVTYVLFFGTLLSVVGIFLLNQQAERQLTGHAKMLEEEQASFDSARLDEVRRLDEQLQLAQKVLDRHAAVSVIFDDLEDIIVETVQLTTFAYKRELGESAKLTLGGITDTFDVLMFQRDALAQSSLLASADLTTVGYGASATLIGLADRGEPRPAEQLAATVTFSFEEENILERIGYRPRAVSEVIPEATETDSAVDQSADGEDLVDVEEASEESQGEVETPAEVITDDSSS